MIPPYISSIPTSLSPYVTSIPSNGISSPLMLPQLPISMSPLDLQAVLAANDNSLANNLASLLQMMVVGNTVGNSLSLNKVPQVLPISTPCSNTIYW